MERPIILKRSDAKAAGSKLYFTGKPCRNGHVALRRTDNGSCDECGRISSASRQRALWASQPEVMREKDKRRDPAKRRTSTKAWRAANPSNVKAWARKHYEKNTEVLLEKSRARHHADRDAAAASNRRWRAANPEQNRRNSKMSKAARKAREAGVDFEPITLSDILKRDGANCYICGIATDPEAHRHAKNRSELEHVIPICKGGGHTWENLRCSCFRCNRLKSHRRTPEEVREFLGLTNSRP